MRSIRFSLCAALLLLIPRVVSAQVSGPTYVFTRGTVANPDEVNSNFSAIYAAALNRTGGTMTGQLNTLVVVPTVTNASDVGSASLFYRSLYLKTSAILGQTTANYTLTWANPASARAISLEDPGGTDIFVWKAATQTLTNKTLTAPVLGGSVTGTYTLAGTPTITAPIFSGTATGTYTLGGTPSIAARALTGSHVLPDGVLSTNVPLLNGTTAFTAFGAYTWNASGAGNMGLVVTNTLSGATNASLLRAVAGTTTGQLVSTSQGYTTGSFDIQASTYVSGSGVGGLSLAASDAAGVIRFFTGTTLRWGVNAAGDLAFGTSSHIALSSGTPSGATFTGGGVGTVATVTGTDYAMLVGSSGAAGNAFTTSLTVTFGHTFSSTPMIVATAVGNVANRATDWYITGQSTTGFTINFTETGSSCTVSGCPVNFYVHVIGT